MPQLDSNGTARAGGGHRGLTLRDLSEGVDFGRVQPGVKAEGTMVLSARLTARSGGLAGVSVVACFET